MSASGQRWWRLSLRELILLVTIAGLACAIWAQGPHFRRLAVEKRRQQRLPQLEYHMIRHASVTNLQLDLIKLRNSEINGRKIEDHGGGIGLPSVVGFNRRFRLTTHKGETPDAVVEAEVRWAISHVWPDEVGATFVDEHTAAVQAKYKEVFEDKELNTIVETRSPLGVMRTTFISLGNSSLLTLETSFRPSRQRLTTLGVDDPDMLDVSHYSLIGVRGGPGDYSLD